MRANRGQFVCSFGDLLLAVKANPVIALLYPWRDLPPPPNFSPSNFVYTCSIPTEPFNTCPPGDVGGFLMFRSIVRVVVPVAMVSVSVLASLANAQVGMPNPIKEPNPLTATLSIFRSNMQDKIRLRLPGV
jgi:hypothetical protein